MDLQNQSSVFGSADNLADPFGEDAPEKSFDASTATPEQIKQILDELNAPLNPEQKLAAETTEGPVMVVAGAGAGKTKTLIHRVASIMVKGVPATNIMVVTFTNKAASEIKERIEGMIGENGQYVHAGTFHSIIFREILKQYGHSNYLQSQNIEMSECAILDDKEAQTLLKDAMAELPEGDLEHLTENEWRVSDVQSVMSEQRAKGHDVFDFVATISPGSRNEVKNRVFAAIWRGFNQKCREVNGMDFDDILVHADKMLKKEPEIAEELGRQFRYIMLDEYQDTNPVQMSIMDSIASQHNNICTVGDEKQSIYKFRGADINVILSFKQRYPDAVMVDMNKNYRSYPSVINFSNALADAMGQRISDGQLNALRKIEEPERVVKQRKSNSVAMVEFKNETFEAEAVVKAIMRDMALGLKGENIAVLYRNRNLKAALERQLVEENVPYKIHGDSSFFQKAEVRDAIAMIRFIFNPWDSVAGFRVLKATSMKVSDQAAKKAMKEQGINVTEFLKQKATERLKAKKKGQDIPDLTKSAVLISPFVKITEMIKEAYEYGDSPVYIRDAIAELWDLYLRPSIESKAKKGKNAESDASVDIRIENVKHVFKRLKESLENGMSVQEVIEDLSLMVENNGVEEDDSTEKVQLMTMHASKGLEFHNVYAIGLDNLTTHGQEPEPDEVEESRRLIYVAMTRAEKKLSMSYSTGRVHNGQWVNVVGSDFFDEIESRTGAKRVVISEDMSRKMTQKLNNIPAPVMS